MDVPIISMDQQAAQVKLNAYREQLRKRADEEYEATVQGYEILASGKPLINLTEAFTAAGLYPDGRPKLAIARADRKQVMVRRHNGAFWFSTLKRSSQMTSYSGDLLISVSLSNPSGKYISDGFSLVPMVPADVRPSGNLKDFFILWEVEQWADRPVVAVPDYDPFLLQYIAGDLYAVVAEWDLTELERAIMTGRRLA